MCRGCKKQLAEEVRELTAEISVCLRPQQRGEGCVGNKGNLRNTQAETRAKVTRRPRSDGGQAPEGGWIIAERSDGLGEGGREKRKTK